MDVILIPGFWLNGDSWGVVTERLREAGHTPHPVTLPGMESVDADRSGITLRDNIDAVMAIVDSLPSGVVLVGHSGGGAIASGVVDARPDAISRVIYVDSGPLGEGDSINDELPVVDGEIPLPDWDVFEDADLIDLTDELRAHFRQIAIPIPARLASDMQVLSDPRRYDVPVTVICCEFPAAQLQQWLNGGVPIVAELAAMKHRTLIDLPTGHWPQLTKPHELADVIVHAL
ncbi:pimeloyl-ACP methyl ester carboxylesterase [Leifsonia sp. AK011]|uniref:alpha/beta fold hydrolase n=1 Tax=Leifsonia sp. AK011 TaxID=2723075 RepID=UPI0015CEF405|nr:alpha/beta hydrolase [Leifsonia sp. AK011]NYF09879.1 pimeloyl-ACP methyl ester carboxylesterase [Leifsonia sp. AK011]